jgi:hypothetical protein
MRVLRWLKGLGAPDLDPRRLAWRNAWTRAAGASDVTALAVLSQDLDGLNLPEEEIEIEREMLVALQDLADLIALVRLSGLPVVPTGHRVVAGDACHFIGPASMPDEPSQPAGRLLLTNRRALFVGGGSSTLPWHRVGAVLQQDRDLVLLPTDHGLERRFRCNSFSEALRSAFVARTLIAAHREPSRGL